LSTAATRPRMIWNSPGQRASYPSMMTGFTAANYITAPYQASWRREKIGQECPRLV
jgi:hypothetical protein